MAQTGPLTSAAQNFFSQFNAAQDRRRQGELIQLQEQKRQDIINAAELKRQQELDDREDLALSIESAIGIDTGTRPEGEQRGAGRVADFVFNDKQRTAFSQAVANNPQVSGPILNFLSKANEFQLQDESNRTARLLRGGLFLQDQIKKSPVRFQEGIKQLVESGLYGEDEVKELVSLSNEPNQDLVNLKLEKLVLDNTPKKILLEEEVAKRKGRRAEQATIGQEARAEQATIRREGRGEQETIRQERRKEQAEIRKEERQPEFKSKIGKLIGDKEIAVRKFGVNSRQVKSLNDAIIGEAGLGFKVPVNHQLVDPNDPTKGVKPIPGGPSDTLSGENAAKAQMLRTAQKAFKGVRELVFTTNDQGETIGLNDLTLFNANFSIPFTSIRGVPFTKGDRLRVKMEFGIQAITRSETGAAMPPEEVENTRQRFMPKVTDTVTTAQLKLDMYEEFINGTLQLLDPTGRFQADRFNAELSSRGGEVTTPPATNQPQRNIVVDF